MSQTKSKLNDKPSEYIEQNILKADPEGLPECPTVPAEGQIVVAKYVPKMRRIMFQNGRDPGQELMFHYHSKTHPLKHYTLYHGFEYDLPEEIIEHLENCAELQYGYRTSVNGHPEMYVKGKKYIFSCKSVKKAA